MNDENLALKRNSRTLENIMCLSFVILLRLLRREKRNMVNNVWFGKYKKKK